MRNTVNPIMVLNQLASKISYDKPQKSYKWELGGTSYERYTYSNESCRTG